MKQFWITFFGSIFGVIVGSVLAVIVFTIMLFSLFASAMSSAENEVALPADGIVLELDLRTGRLDSPSSSPFAFSEPLSVVDVVRTLERAEADSRVQGLFIRANEFGMSPATAEEIRTAITNFQASGRFVMTHAQGFEGTSLTGYYAVAASDEIWLQDTASFTPAGLAAEITFLGGLFEQFDAVPQFEQFYEYKNAANQYVETSLTEAHREAMTSYMTSIYDTAVASIADDRGQSVTDITGVFETAPHTAETAQEVGMIDRLGHVVEAREAALARAGAGSSAVSIHDYAQAPADFSSAPVISQSATAPSLP